VEIETTTREIVALRQRATAIQRELETLPLTDSVRSDLESEARELKTRMAELQAGIPTPSQDYERLDEKKDRDRPTPPV
jgi:hypothetical protein